MFVKGISMLFILFAVSSGIELSTLSQGLTKSHLQSAVIRNKEELKKIWDRLGIRDKIPTVDFEKELVIILAPSRRGQGSVQISGVEKKGNNIEVRFIMRPYDAVDSKIQSTQLSPYIVAKLYPLVDVEETNVEFFEDIPRPLIPTNNGIGQGSSYTNVLSGYKNMTTSQFLPLDTGSVWTYRVESNGSTREETYSILSISQDGWSIFDNFFGQRQIAMRIDPVGDIYVLSKSGIASFYTPEIQKIFKRSQFSTPAGRFNDLMIVTIPKTDGFWFKDVYAKGVGLIYHEQESPKGVIKYTLVRAHVRGKDYPGR
jgi:hypothetical protein